MTDAHLPVLLEEAMQALNIQPHGRYVDATYGRGGHARAVLARLGPQGRLLALDRDPEAVRQAQAQLQDPRFCIQHRPFSELTQALAQQGWQDGVQGVLLDLGVSSPQLDVAGRGFSFQQDGPLDMRMDPTSGESAAQWLARASETDIAVVLRELGEERHAGRIARAIVRARQEAPLTRTAQLAAVIAAAAPRDPHKHAATRSFQAIRLYVNRELEELDRVLPAACAALVPGGRLAVISFHSLEDRRVKHYLRDQARTAAPRSRFQPPAPVHAASLRLCGGGQRASEAECAANPRARSATLRCAERLA
jgi:16S rRNA (cytosine1402-N4)-methyltransferase